MRQKKHNPLDMEATELNLIPYMDIMVNLIMFLLVSMTSFLQLRIINVSVPAIGESRPEDQKEDDEKQLAVVIGIVEKKGFLISVDGNFLEGTPPNEPTVKNLPNGDYDFATLQSKMEVVKTKQPSLRALTIVPDRKVDYNTLVKTMDAIRHPKDRSSEELFPDVLLGVQ